jgi:hypothetical protein
VELERITEKIAEALTANLVATPYLQGVTESWRESPNPTGDVGGESAHLTFSVLCRASPVTDQRRGQTGEVIRCKSAIEVVFAYHVRADTEVEDTRLAKRAAREIIAVVNDESKWLGPGDGDDVVVRVRERFRPTFLLTDEPYVLVAVGFDIDHDEEI